MVLCLVYLNMCNVGRYKSETYNEEIVAAEKLRHIIIDIISRSKSIVLCGLVFFVCISERHSESQQPIHLILMRRTESQSAVVHCSLPN